MIIVLEVRLRDIHKIHTRLPVQRTAGTGVSRLLQHIATKIRVVILFSDYLAVVLSGLFGTDARYLDKLGTGSAKRMRPVLWPFGV
jgi:hypothetical protein